MRNMVLVKGKLKILNKILSLEMDIESNKIEFGE